MTELVHERNLVITDENGVVYDRVRVYAERQSGGTWAGFIEFVAADGSGAVRTERETTQSNVRAVAYWATGLEPIYFEGALGRALRHLERAPAASVGVSGWRTARLELVAIDPVLPLRIMGTRTLVPGQERRIQGGGALVYEGTPQAPTATEAGRYAFEVRFASENGAALAANALWSELHEALATVIIEGAHVAINHGAMKDALIRTARSIGEAA